MIWLGVALLSAVVAGVGFWRGTTSGLSSQALPAAAGVLFSLLMFRASTLITDKKALGKKGGWPMLAAGALTLTAMLGAALDVVNWLRTKMTTVGPWLLPVAALGLVLVAIAALRFSLDSPRRTHFYVLAVAAVANGVAAAFLFLQVLQNTPHL
ncbi:MAG: hypothetical protein ACO1OB_04750 [Archangium sp.]